MMKKEITTMLYCPKCGVVKGDVCSARNCPKCGRALREKVVVR